MSDGDSKRNTVASTTKRKLDIIHEQSAEADYGNVRYRLALPGSHGAADEHQIGGGSQSASHNSSTTATKNTDTLHNVSESHSPTLYASQLEPAQAMVPLSVDKRHEIFEVV